MSEIDRKLGLSIFSSSFSEQEIFSSPGSVAAAISSALETTAEDHTDQNDRNFYQQNYNQHSYNTRILNSSNNCSFKNSSNSLAKEDLVSSATPHYHTTLLLPVAPTRPESGFVDGAGCGSGGSDNNGQFLLTSSNNNIRGNNKNRQRDSRNRTLSTDSADGNHVDDQFRSSSACSQQFRHHQPFSSSFSSSSSQMADKQEYSSSFIENKTISVRDKSDNRETYPVSHCKEKSATDNREVDTGGGGGVGGSNSRIFKPSSKIIDLPEKSTSSSSNDHRQSSHHNHPHHHHSRSKDSRIPVGIAVAWQRLVTTSSSNPGVNSTMTTKADCGNQAKSKMNTNSLSSSAIKHPSRPSSASSLKNAGKMMSSNPSYSSNSLYASNPNLSGFCVGGGAGDNNSDILSSSNNNRPMSACGDAISGSGNGTHVPYCPSPAPSPALSRPLPSSSVPPNLGYLTGYSSQYPTHPYHNRNAVSPYLEYSYAAAAAAQRPFVVPSPVSSPHHHHSHPSLLASNGHPYWGLDNPPPPPVPLLSPGISPGSGVAPTDYLQQFSLQQQQMHLHSPHHLHQQHLTATPSRQLSSPPSPSTTSSSSSYNPYLPFLYPQDAAASLAAVASAAATMNKNTFYDHYFHQQQQQQQMLLQNQGYLQQPHPSIPTPPVSGGNSGSSSSVNSSNSAVSNNNNANKNSGSGNSVSSRFDLLANNDNNNASNTSGGGGSAGNVSNASSINNTHRAIPMQVASPISRTSISLLSCSPTGAGRIRTPTPTASSTSSSTAAASATTTTTATVTSSAGSAFSTFPPSTTTTSQENPAGSSSHSSVAAAPSSPAGLQQLISSSTPTTTTITATSPSPSLFLLHHQQQHPHLFSGSTAALSPKSLTSSTPSPVTVHDFNSGLNVVISSSAAANNNNNSTTTNSSMATATRKCATPSPISLTPTRALLSPFPPGSPYGSPSPIPSNNNNNNGSYKELLVWKDDTSLGTRIKPIPINGHTRETHSYGGGSLTTPPPLSSPLLSLAHHNNMRNNNNNGKITSVSTPMSSPGSYIAGQKHDFKRLESLIERRDSESISPLVLIPQHSPATSTTSSLIDSSADEQQQAKLAALAAEEKADEKRDNAAESQDDDEQVETFCISVKLENPTTEEDECQQRSNNDQNDSFKVKPPTTTKIRHDVVETTAAIATAHKAVDKQEERKICMMKSESVAATSPPKPAEIDQVDGESKEKVEIFSDAINKLDSPSITTIPCDASNNATTTNTDPNTCDGNGVGESNDGEDARINQHGGLHPNNTFETTADKVDDANNEEVVGGNDVPEPTLLLCSSNNSSANNFNDTLCNNKSTDGCFKRNSSFSKDSNSLIKDVSFTSGYSSSQEDNNNEQQKQSSLLIISPSLKIPAAASKKTKKAVKIETKPSLKIMNKNKNKKEKKTKPEKKVKEKLSSMPTAEGELPPKEKKRKKMKDTNNSSFKVAASTLFSSKPAVKTCSTKKTSNVCSKVTEKMSKTKKGAAALKKVAAMSLLSSSTPPISLLSPSSFPKDSQKVKKEKKVRINEKLSNDGKVKVARKTRDFGGNEKVKNKKGIKTDVAGKKGINEIEKKVGSKKSKTSSIGVAANEGKRKKKGSNATSKPKNAKLGPQGISQQGWVPPSTVPVSSALTNNNYQRFVKANKSDTSSFSFSASSNMTSVSGDIIHSGNYNHNTNYTDQINTSLTSNNPNLQQQQHQQPMAVVLHQSSPALQSPSSQVTFLITSPTSDRTGGTSPLRIPAYIPRSGSSATAVVASADELVGGNGDSYTGPATLTLHRDVDAIAQSQTFYQPPPAITIQYHHSAPATPMTMEAASPSSLDLLATVAQEFGSREDLGKRLSIDGCSSCNASSIGESPPMSPQKSPGAYHQHYSSQYSNVPVLTQNQQKRLPNTGEIMTGTSILTTGSVPLASVPTFSASTTPTTGKRPKSPKKQQVKAAKKKAESKNTKTSNSITLKQSSKKKAMMMKVGKKEKRTVSDSATVYTSPVVLLKIPQVPGLCSKKTLLQQQQQKQQQDKAKKAKDKNSKVKADNLASIVGEISRSKSKPIDNKKVEIKTQVKDNDKLVLFNIKEIKSKKSDKTDNANKKEEKKSKRAAALSSSSSSTPLLSPKSLLLLSLPISTTVTTTSSKNGELQVKKKEKKVKTEGRRRTQSSSSSLSSPLSIPLPSTTMSSTDQIITLTPSPTKDRSSSFYNPPERISAFAKQVISRRSSAAGVSPTKLQINSTTASPFKQQQGSVFFPIQQQPQGLPNSPTIKMPQLIPFDVPLEPSTPTSPSSKQHSFSLPPSSSLSLAENHNDSSSSSVPKTVNFKRFPNSSKLSPSHLPPPLLVPSVSGTNSSSSSSSHDKKDYCDVNDDARYLSSSEQDKEKTDNIVITIENRSPSSCSRNKASCKEKKRKDKDNGRLEKKRKKGKHDNNDEYKKSKKKRRSNKLDKDLCEHKKKTKKKKKSSSKSPVMTTTKVPTITVTQQSSALPTTPNSSIAFSPLTPPLTAKSLMEGENGDDGIKEHHHRTSAFACLKVPGGSSTPCSSLPSHRSTPSVHAEEEEGQSETTENENENDSGNVWVSDPMFAVSAIKLTNISSAGSNQPTDAEESAHDDDIDIDSKVEKKSSPVAAAGRKDNMPLKLSLLNVKQQQESSNPLSPEQKEQQDRERERFLEVKSQLKAFVHFKPKQLTGNKKGHHNIKPCLKAEPIVRSRNMDDEEEDVIVDDDEDFHLDMEVANITTQNAPGRKVGEKCAGSIIPATATSCAALTTTSSSVVSTGSNKKRKPSINRNSSSYITSNSSSSSQSKKHHGLSTKEIMSKVFSRKVSPELSERKLKKRRRSSACLAPGTEMDADDEEDEEDELLDIDDAPPLPFGKSHSSHNHHHQFHHPSHNTHIAMSAAAAAVVVNSNVAQPASSTSSLSSSSLALLSSLTSMKKPKKRSARSSTTSSCASTKSTNRGNRGQSGTSAISSSVGGSGTSAVTLNTRASVAAATSSATATKENEIQVPGKVELDSVQELVDEMRILTDIQGLFYTGRLNALQPPDVYGVTLDNERGAPPHLIFSAEEVLEKCLREKKPQPEGLCPGMRICAYWSPQYSGLYPGRVSSDFSPKFDPDKDLIPIEFDDGDTGMIKLKEIRLLSVNHPVREYDPNPLLTLEKKHRKRRHSSATGTSGGCTGDHEEPDCGEPYCAKIGKLEEDDEDDVGDEDDDHTEGGAHHHHSSSKMLYWTWSGLGYKTPKSKKNRNKEFFHGIQRGNEVINVGDAALFISTGNERPFIGRVERFWETKGKKMVNVRWFYHPEEVKASAKRLSNLKYPGALFESPHIDENDVQTIAKKCDVLPFSEFKKRLSGSSAGSLRVAKLSVKSSSKPRDMYYVAGFYDPYTYNLTLKDLK